MALQKYFIALVIPEPFQTEITELKNFVKENYNSKAALHSPAHITLHMPFEWKEEKETVLINTLNKFSFDKKIEIELKNFSCFEPRVIFVDVVKNETLNQLQKELVVFAMKNLNLLNQANDMRGFHPHITIAFRDLKKERFYEAINYLKALTYHALFNVDEIYLLKQHSGKEWLTYHCVKLCYLYVLLLFII